MTTITVTKGSSKTRVEISTTINAEQKQSSVKYVYIFICILFKSVQHTKHMVRYTVSLFFIE